MIANENRRFAVLIDADNAQASTIESILAEIARYGTVTSKRCYGDWTKTNLSPWKTTLLKFAIQPMQQFGYTTGKNATDSAMIIDAMDLLFTGNFDGFCIVSSDSDFTRQATRLRESGLEVLGFGRKTTPEPFRVACNKFTFTEILLNSSGEDSTTDSKPVSSIPTSSVTDSTNDLQSLFKEAIESQKDDDGFASLADVGSYIQRIRPDFDSRTYGAKKLGDLMKKQKYVEFILRKDSHPFVRFMG